MKTNEVLVSATLITYNQEKYVAQAIESMVKQETNFKFEILVGDDCSTDNTPKILKEYRDKHPDKIKLFLREKNVGATKNGYLLRKEAKGKYLTSLEGDDYWLNNNRLQYLVDFLQDNPEYVGVSHRRERRDTDGILLGYDPVDDVLNKPFTVEDFLKGKRYSASGSLYKNFYLGSGDKYEKIRLTSRHVGDFQTCMVVLDMGPVYVTDQCFGVYRVRNKEKNASNYNSITTLMERYYDHINLIKVVDEFFSCKYDFTRERANQHAIALLNCVKTKNYKELKNIARAIQLKEWMFTLLKASSIGYKHLIEKGNRT